MERILEETVEQAVKDATIELLAEIEALKKERDMWNDNYIIVFDLNLGLEKKYNTLQNWNTAGWITAGVELAVLILSWTLHK